jgi:hypothetical protein
MPPHLVVIGGGAAGLFCAVNAARLHPELQVTILEKSNRLLSKVVVSGGGRCNITHDCQDPDLLCTFYPRGRHFLRKAFRQFAVSDTIQWFEARGVKIAAEPDGRMFPVTNQSQTVVDCLVREANRYGVEIMMHAGVTGLDLLDTGFRVRISDTRNIDADFVCVATGGFPKLEQYHWLSGTGHRMIEPVPSLFTLNVPRHPLNSLMGISIDQAVIKVSGTSLQQKGPVLITHWGLSGPAVLRLSAWGARELHKMQYRFRVQISWVPDYHEEELRQYLHVHRNEKGSVPVSSRNPFSLPQRLWNFLLDESGVAETSRWSELPLKAQNKLAKNLVDYTLEVSGKTTFKEEFVTAGGVSTVEIDPTSMQSKLCKRLFFAGEIMDVDGVTGGFNFQHAWTSGFLAAAAIASGN